jgi:hypothetical protein
LHREKKAFHIRVKERVKMPVCIFLKGAKLAKPTFEDNVELAFLPLNLCEEAIKVVGFRDVSLYVGYILSDLRSRRPAMKTYAPSFTKCFAVARPIPLFRPVIRTIFLPAYSSLLSSVNGYGSTGRNSLCFAKIRCIRIYDSNGDPLKAIVVGYLSLTHRDDPGNGCVLAALGADVARKSPAVRHAATEGIRPS